MSEQETQINRAINILKHENITFLIVAMDKRNPGVGEEVKIIASGSPKEYVMKMLMQTMDEDKFFEDLMLTTALSYVANKEGEGSCS